MGGTLQTRGGAIYTLTRYEGNHVAYPTWAVGGSVAAILSKLIDAKVCDTKCLRANFLPATDWTRGTDSNSSPIQWSGPFLINRLDGTPRQVILKNLLFAQRGQPLKYLSILMHFGLEHDTQQ